MVGVVKFAVTSKIVKGGFVVVVDFFRMQPTNNKLFSVTTLFGSFAMTNSFL